MHVHPSTLPPEIPARFWAKVRPDDSGCWLWQSAHFVNGYGGFGFCLPTGERVTYLAHRLAYQLAYGEDPGRQQVQHRCDVRSCCRPSHLSLGDHASNSQQMYERGRHPCTQRPATAVLLPSPEALALDGQILARFTLGTYRKRIPAQPPVQCTCEICSATFLSLAARQRQWPARYCSRACYIVGMHTGLTHTGRAVTPLATRFWRYVDRTTTPDGCWPWTGGHNQRGYGKLQLSVGRTGVAHRVAYELQCGPIPDGMHVCHTCDNPPCCRGDHLFLGTAKDNVADKFRKGRANLATGDRHPMRLHPELRHTGTHNPMAKLTEADVVWIREQYASGGVSQAQLAATMGVSASLIGFVVHRLIWQHV